MTPEPQLNAHWSLTPGGTGGSGNVIPQGPTTITVGGVPIGTDLGFVSVPWQTIFIQTYYPYANPTFSSFIITGQATTVEVGTTISGNHSFAWTFTNIGNVQANTMDILDVTGAVSLATNISIVSPSTQNVGSVQLVLPGTYQWRGSADNTNLVTFNSAFFTVTWEWKVYTGTSASVTLNEAGIEGLVTAALQAGFANTYNFAAGNYKYFCWPDSMGSPTAGTGFKDTNTLLSVAMASAVDNAFYSNVQNGWSYGLVSVTNTFGITTNYRVYRTKFQLGSTLQVLVS